MNTINPWATTGLRLERKHEGRKLRLTADFGVLAEHFVRCPTCHQSTDKMVTRFEGFRKGNEVLVERVEHSDEAVHAMGQYEGEAHIVTVELRRVGTKIVKRFAYEDLKVPGEWV